MIKKLTLTTALLSTLLLTGCNDDKKSTEDVSDREYLMIVQNVIAGECESAEARDELSLYLTHVITQEVSSGATCSDYNKVEDINCLYEDANEGSKDCLVGFDDVKEDYKLAKVFSKK